MIKKLTDKQVKSIEEAFGIKRDPKPYDSIAISDEIYVFDNNDRLPYLEIDLREGRGKVIQFEMKDDIVKAMKKLLEILEDEGNK